MTIERLENGPRFCRVLRHNGTVYVAGLTADDLSSDTTAQTADPGKIDALSRQGRQRQDQASQRPDLAEGHRRLRQDERGMGRLDRQERHAGASDGGGAVGRRPVSRRDHGHGGCRLRGCTRRARENTMHELVIKGGRVALDDDWAECDIGIDDGRIAAIGSGLAGQTLVDAGGRWVMPGGIDAHCHLDQPVWGGAGQCRRLRVRHDLGSIRRHDLHRPVRHAGPGHDDDWRLDRALDCAAGQAVIDYGLHAVVTMGTGADVEEQLALLAGRGIASVKLFMTYQGFAVDDDLFFKMLDAARGLGWIVMVHAENDAAIRRTRQRLIDLGRTDMRYHVVAHSETMEREATHRALAFAEMTGTRMTIVHVSSWQSAEEIARARTRGVDVIAETCPQYLFVGAADLDRPADRRRAFRLFAAAAFAAQPGASVAGTDQWRHRPVVLRPFPLFFRRQDRQGRDARLHHHAERHSRHRDASAAAVLGRAADRPPDASPAISISPRAMPHRSTGSRTQGQDRGRARRGSGAVGSDGALDARPRGPAFTRRLHALRGQER